MARKKRIPRNSWTKKLSQPTFKLYRFGRKCLRKCLNRKVIFLSPLLLFFLEFVPLWLQFKIAMRFCYKNNNKKVLSKIHDNFRVANLEETFEVFILDFLWLKTKQTHVRFVMQNTILSGRDTFPKHEAGVPYETIWTDICHDLKRDRKINWEDSFPSNFFSFSFILFSFRTLKQNQNLGFK